MPIYRASANLPEGLPLDFAGNVPHGSTEWLNFFGLGDASIVALEPTYPIDITPELWTAGGVENLRRFTDCTFTLTADTPESAIVDVYPLPGTEEEMFAMGGEDISWHTRVANARTYHIPDNRKTFIIANAADLTGQNPFKQLIHECIVYVQ